MTGYINKTYINNVLNTLELFLQNGADKKVICNYVKFCKEKLPNKVRLEKEG